MALPNNVPGVISVLRSLLRLVLCSRTSLLLVYRWKGTLSNEKDESAWWERLQQAEQAISDKVTLGGSVLFRQPYFPLSPFDDDKSPRACICNSLRCSAKRFVSMYRSGADADRKLGFESVALVGHDLILAARVLCADRAQRPLNA